MNNKYIKIAAIIMPVLLAVICLVLVVRNDNQASMPIPMNLTFTGEFSYDGENWQPYNEDSDMSALNGDVTVRGHFDVDLPEGAILNFYNNPKCSNASLIYSTFSCGHCSTSGFSFLDLL